MTKAQENVLAALKNLSKKHRPWIPHSMLSSYHAATVNALFRQGLIEIDLEYGVRVKA